MEQNRPYSKDNTSNNNLPEKPVNDRRRNITKPGTKNGDTFNLVPGQV
jgi:hypothetical protein